MNERRILIVDPRPDSRSALASALAALGHSAIATATRDEALARISAEEFDIIISDLVVDADAASSDDGRRSDDAAAETKGGAIGVFRVDVAGRPCCPYREGELRGVVAAALAREPHAAALPRERAEFELPSDLTFMHDVLRFLVDRAVRRGLVRGDTSHLYVALDEAFVNAVIHGNRRDATKFVRVAADFTEAEARFTIEDEGEGFDHASLPDPRDPANLFKTSGRGVLLIHNIMDEVEYNERGNRLTMIKRAGSEEPDAGAREDAPPEP